MLSKTVIYEYVNNLTATELNAEIVKYVFGDSVKFYTEDNKKIFYIDSENINSIRYTKYNTDSRHPLPSYTNDGRMSIKLLTKLNKSVTILPIKNMFTVSAANFSVTDKSLIKAVAKLFLMENYFDMDFLPCL